jgi:acetylornithine deacetylase/succinyl-diaminopimelate desuccinylase-like protein
MNIILTLIAAGVFSIAYPKICGDGTTIRSDELTTAEAVKKIPDAINFSDTINVPDTIIIPKPGNGLLASCEKYIQQKRKAHIEELVDFLEIPSVSSLPAHDTDMKRAAQWLAKKLTNIGMTTAEVVPTGGHPVVFSTWNQAKDKPTVLIYGHYDVQPVDEKQWSTPPFEAKQQGGRIYARGAADDKGGLLIPVWATEAILKVKGSLPVNVIFIFDGEEEIGSPHFKEFLQKHHSLLQADFAYYADGAQFNDSVPSMWMGLRGSAALEFTVQTAHTDAHSGIYGGKTPNAAKAAAQIIASLYTPDGKVAVAGFYDSVQPLTKEERDRLLQVPYDPGKDMKDLGTITDIGDSAYTPLERLWYRPTLEGTGIWGGYTAPEGFANIIPGTAHVRLNCRLVANQKGEEVVRLIQKHIHKYCPQGATVQFKEPDSYAAPIKFPATGDSFQFAYDVLTKVYNRQPLLTAIGGSIGAITQIKEVLGIYTYSFGFQQTDENFHAANEFIRLSDVEKGQKAFCVLLEHIGRDKRK